MKEEKLKEIKYITIPNDLKTDLGGFKLDSKIMLPVQLQGGRRELQSEDVTVENIVSGLITVVAYEEENPHFTYYRDLLNAIEPGLADELNKAAIAKEKQKDYDFAEELFLAVYHLLPQSASCINLATLYSYMAVKARDEKNSEDEDKYLLQAKRTLKDGLTKFGENESILSELSSFEAYMGNLEEAKEYLDRYLNVASEGDRKEELKKVKEQIELQLRFDNEIKEAYDFIMLGLPEKALPVIDSFIASNPKVWNGYFLKGWALRIAKRYSEAKSALLECIRLGESNGEIYNELSICELEDGDRELAKTYLDTAADLDPTNLSIQSNLAFLHLMDGEFDQARENLERARYLSGDDEIVKGLIEQYQKITGEEIGTLIHEDIVEDEDSKEVEEDDGYEEELRVINGEDSEEDHCSCNHHNSSDECGCGHHHPSSSECGCGHHHHHQNQCGCGHHHEE